jgi:hypothetical protein
VRLSERSLCSTFRAVDRKQTRRLPERWMKCPARQGLLPPDPVTAPSAPPMVRLCTPALATRRPMLQYSFPVPFRCNSRLRVEGLRCKARAVSETMRILLLLKLEGVVREVWFVLGAERLVSSQTAGGPHRWEQLGNH